MAQFAALNRSIPTLADRVDANPRTSSDRVAKSRFRVLLLAVLGLAAVLRLTSLLFPYTQPDEVITLEVARRIVETGNLDTNWKLAALPEEFKYPQYNFSAYLLSTSAVLGLAKPLMASVVSPPLDLLRLYSALLGVLVVGLTALLGRQLFNVKTGLIAALLAALCPLLYQDSLYARPETFVTVLTLACLLLMGVTRLDRSARIFLASILLGVAVATKVSLLMLVPALALAPVAAAPTPTEAIRPRDALVTALRLAPLIVVGIWLGFALGAPFAIINFGDFLLGLQHLNRQYNEVGTWPHGLPDAGILSRLGYAVRYFGSTMGYPILLVSAIGAGLAVWGRQWRKRGYYSVGFVPSVLPWDPPSTLNTYFTPTVVFLLRDRKVGCLALKPHAS
jgi:4-amino-4-deoxy-L-arabinose transferase-like glycosyltransferase